MIRSVGLSLHIKRKGSRGRNDVETGEETQRGHVCHEIFGDKRGQKGEGRRERRVNHHGERLDGRAGN